MAEIVFLGIIFLDKDFNMIPFPEELNDQTYTNLIGHSDYIFFDDVNAINLWYSIRKQYEMFYDPNPFTKPGAYMWDYQFEEWVNIWDKINILRDTISKVSQAYISQANLPLQNAKEGE